MHAIVHHSRRRPEFGPIVVAFHNLYSSPTLGHSADERAPTKEAEAGDLKLFDHLMNKTFLMTMYF